LANNSKATHVLVTAMEQARVKRLVCVTGFGAGDSRDRGGFFYCVASHLLLGRIYNDKDVQEHIVRRSKLDWVIVRPVILTNRLKTNAYSALIDSRDWTCGFISRADVADFLVEQIDNDAFLHKIQCSRAEGIVAMAKPMIEKKKIDIVDDFINKVQSHPTAMQKAQRIDDLEAVLRAICLR
jgi:NAD(P)H-binding